jgi:hypothetical protein
MSASFPCSDNHPSSGSLSMAILSDPHRKKVKRFLEAAEQLPICYFA